jgi:hypothetical protein
MIGPKLKGCALLSITLLVLGGVLPGCAGDADQPGRETISAPRQGGGLTDVAGEKMKTKTAPASKPGGGAP